MIRFFTLQRPRAVFYLVCCLLLFGPFLFAQDQDQKAQFAGLSSKDISDSLTLYNRIIEEAHKASEYYKRQVSQERKFLIKDIQTMRTIFPLSQYNGEILLRLAELYYEEETERFDNMLDQRDKLVEAAEKRGDTANIPFPELKFETTLAIA